MEEETNNQTEREESQISRLRARVERLETEAAHQREETAALRARMEEQSADRHSDEESVVRWKTSEDIERLVQFIFDAIAEGRVLELDQDEARRLASRRWNTLAEVVTSELERRGQSPGDLDAMMGWPGGWAESLLAEPARFPYKEIRRVSERLGIPMSRLFEPTPPAAPPRED